MNGTNVIETLDMSGILVQLMAKGMSAAKAQEACEAGRQDLLLVAAHVGQAIVPTAVGDEAIHVLLEIPEACKAIAEAIAGPGALLVHTEGPGGDWERSQAWRRELFGQDSKGGIAGCMLEVKGSNAAGCMLEVKSNNAAGCMFELQPAQSSGRSALIQ